jgi:pyridoxal phosphate enzyme (YggS family)
MDYSYIKNNLTNLLTAVRTAEKNYHRPANAVDIIAVTKQRSSEEIKIAIDSGQLNFGENYVQEAIPKIIAINDPRVVWHFIGPIQTNKTKLIAQYFSWVQSVDRLKIAQRLSEQRAANLSPLNVCIQVNISDEVTKSGITTFAEILELAEGIKQLPRLKLRGLMTIPKLTDEFAEQRAIFSQMRKLFDQLQSHGFVLDTLSMGMSADYLAAIAEGATMLRIGSKIFDKY